MTENASANQAESTAETKEEAKKDEGSFFVFLLKLALIVVIFRSFIFSPFNIPSESMMPGLVNGDQLLAAKWSYGYSENSFPLVPGRIFASPPERGDVVIFKHPIDGTDYIKRAIGLPGDTVEMRDGQIILNGEPVPKEPIANFVIAQSPNTQCHAFSDTVTLDDGTSACSYQQFRETLPNGVSYNVLDFGTFPQDDFAPVVVPKDKFFAMGDNRDNSLDSRFPAEAAQGIGIVPEENLVARASVMMWSTDGGAEWLKPWTWFTAARWERIGSGL
jgi:signal peptidase I